MASSSIVGFVGLDELSLELAASLVRSGFRVQAFEETTPMMDAFVKLGGAKCASPVEAGRDAAATIFLVSPADQIDVFFRKEGSLEGNRKDSVIILRSTIPPTHIQKLE